MSQSQPFEDFQKRKYITTPKKSFYRSGGKRKQIHQEVSPLNLYIEPNNYSKTQKTLNEYFSPTAELKKLKKTPNNADSVKNSPATPNIYLKRKLFESDENDTIILTDDEVDESFQLHIEPNSRNNTIFPVASVISENLNNIKVSPIEECNLFSNKNDNSHLINKLDITTYDAIKDLKDNQGCITKRNNEANPEIIEVIDDDSQECLKNCEDLQISRNRLEIHLGPTLQHRDEEISKNQVSLLQIEQEVSPTKSTLSVCDAVSLVSDIDWTDESDFAEVMKSNSTKPTNGKNIPQTNETNSLKNVEDPNINKTEHRCITQSENPRPSNEQDIRKYPMVSTGGTLSNSQSFENRNHSFYSDSLDYIINTPPAMIAWETLFLHSEYQNIHKSFNSLSSEEKRLYSRLFGRKNDWIRKDNIKYDFVTDIDLSLTNIANKGLIQFLNTDNIKLSEALNLMQLDEVKKICDVVMVNKKGKKADVIDSILKRLRNQPTLNFGNVKPKNKIKTQILELLPKHVKLEEKSRNLFMSFLLISTYAQHKLRDENRLLIVVDLLIKLNNGTLRMLDVPLVPMQIFKTLANFRDYETSVNLVDLLLAAKKEKNWELAKSVILNAKTELKVYLGIKENIIDLNQMFDYLKKFSPGANYVYILHEGIDVLKKDKTTAGIAETVECITLLLTQKYFLIGRRAFWYCELALLLERWKQFDEVFIALKAGLLENSATSLGKLMLAQRCEMLIKKRHGLSEPQKNELTELSKMEPFRFTICSISSTSMPNVTTSNKQMWTKMTDAGRAYMNVEEVARQHYMSPSGGNYSDGYHDEGRIILNLVICAFWKVVYIPLDCMFHVQFQDRPLDWGSSSFYHNRYEAISGHIQFLKEGGIDGIIQEITDVCTKYQGTISLVSWDLMRLEQIHDIKKFLECLGVEPFLNLCNYILQAYKERASGLPDLTLWDSTKSKCLFVEVKGPSDKLSAKQTFWLHKLKEFGIDAEVCHVNTMHTGKRNVGQDNTSQ